ncbi:MAG TPA: PKD domain-containing protein, partial [Thermoleophilaceae bacterium]
YSIGADGALSPLAGSPFSSGEYGDIAITPDGKYLYATTGAQIKHFAIGSDGKLTEAATSTPLAAAFLTPSPDSRFLFAGSTATPDSVTSFSIAADGGLTANGAPALTGNTGLHYFAVGPDGRHVYMPDSNLDGVVVAAVAADGTLTVTGTMPVQNPESVAVSPDGRFLYISKSGSILVASIAADGTPTLLPSTAAWTSGEPERLYFGPTPPPVAAFTSHEGPPGAGSRFDATGSTGAARFDWDFGDGTTLVDGGPKPTHVYAGAGVYDVHLTVYDAQGCSGTFIYTGQSTTCPGGFGTLATAGLDTLPILDRLRVGPRRFVAAAAARRKARRGTTFRYRVNERGTVKITIARKKGRRYKRVGAIRAPGHIGANRKRFSGKLRGKRLKPGTYRATAVATDSNGGRSRPRSIRFKIVG